MDVQIRQQSDTVRIPHYANPILRPTAQFDAANMEQHYLNCYPDSAKDVQTGDLEIAIIKRPGIYQATDPAHALSPTIGSYGTSDTMQCLCNIVMTQLYDVYVGAWFDSTASKIYIIQYRPISQTTTKIGEISSAHANDVVFITETTQGDSLLPAIGISYQAFDRSFGTGYYAITTTGVFTTASLTTISSGSFPANLGTPRIVTGPFQYMNGHNYIMTIDGFIYMSSLTAAGNPDISTWNTLGTVVASQYPDRGVGLFRYKAFLLAFGQDSVEFWSDVSNPPPAASIERTDQAFIKFGALNPKLITNIDDVIYWLSYSSNGTVGIWKLDGFVPTKISTPKEDYLFTNQISTSSTPLASAFSLESLMLQNKRHLFINNIITQTQCLNSSQFAADAIPINSATDLTGHILCYCIDEKAWWSCAGLSSTMVAIVPTTSYGSTAQLGTFQQYFFTKTASLTSGQDAVNSTVYAVFNLVGSSSNYVDLLQTNGILFLTYYTVVIQSNHYFFSNVKRKRLNRLSVIADFLGTDATLYIGYNKVNNILTPDNTILRRTAPQGADVDRIYINNLGTARSLNVSVIFKGSYFVRLRGLELDVVQGTA